LLQDLGGQSVGNNAVLERFDAREALRIHALEPVKRVFVQLVH
jgi:hypothetical protein